MTKWVIHTILFLVLGSCTEKSKDTEVVSKTEDRSLTEVRQLYNNDVRNIKWNGRDSHLKGDDESGGERVIERTVYVGAASGINSYDVEELIEQIDELEDEVEELHRKLDDIEEYTNSAKNSLEDALYFHLPGAFDDVERYLHEIEWECSY